MVIPAINYEIIELTYMDLVEKAFNNEFKITKKEAQEICWILEQGEYKINWKQKGIYVNSLSYLFKWED